MESLTNCGCDWATIIEFMRICHNDLMSASDEQRYMKLGAGAIKNIVSPNKPSADKGTKETQPNARRSSISDQEMVYCFQEPFLESLLALTKKDYLNVLYNITSSDGTFDPSALNIRLHPIPISEMETAFSTSLKGVPSRTYLGELKEDANVAPSSMTYDEGRGYQAMNFEFQGSSSSRV
jgi:hypothetical protein